MNHENHHSSEPPSSLLLGSTSSVRHELSTWPPTSGTPSPTGQAWLPPCSVLGSCPPCMDGLNNTVGEAAETPGITLWMGPQSPDGQASAVAGQRRRAGGESSPMADTGHSLVQLTQSGGHLSPPCSPPAPLTGQAQPHSQKQGDGQDGMGMGGRGDRQARRSKRRGRAAESSWSGLLRFHLTRQAGGSTHELQAPDRRPPRAHANSAT